MFFVIKKMLPDLCGMGACFHLAVERSVISPFHHLVLPVKKSIVELLVVAFDAVGFENRI